MNNTLKRGVCLFLCLTMAFALSACSGSAMTEKNITKTVALAEKALKDFDRDALAKYVKSSTLKVILSLAKNHNQFVSLGQAMFEKLEIEVKSVDTKSKTVTVLVKNRQMGDIGSQFATELTSKYQGLELLSKINDDTFLDESLKKLTAEISEATVPDNPEEITLTVEKGTDSLVLVFDKEGENAVSGGAFSAISDSLSNSGAQPSSTEAVTQKATQEATTEAKETATRPSRPPRPAHTSSTTAAEDTSD